MRTTKFRRLRLDELEEVRPQFVRFLSVNGIDGETWTKIKMDEPERTDELLLQFSEIVFRGVIERVTYLLQRSKHDLRAYRCAVDKVTMNGLLIEGTTTLDLSNPDLPPEQMLGELKASGATVKLYSGERAYRDGDRERDLFLLMEQGAKISDGSMYELLEGLKSTDA